MIERLEIFDYRSCMHTTFDLQPDLSVIIGPNGSGKTNILQAFLLLRSLTFERDVDSRRYLEELDESRIKGTFRVEEKKTILTANVQVVADENNADVIVSAKQSWYAKDFTGDTKRFKIPLSLIRYLDFYHRRKDSIGAGINFGRAIRRWEIVQEIGDRAVPESYGRALGRIAAYLREIQYYSASQFTNPSRCPVSIEVEQEGERRRGLGIRGVHRKFLYDLYGARDSDGYNEFFNVIGPNGIGLIDAIEFKEILTSSVEHTVRSGGRVQQRKREKMIIVPQFKIGPNELSPNQLSEGTFKTITLLFYFNHAVILFNDGTKQCALN
jgi:hypothetical protein